MSPTFKFRDRTVNIPDTEMAIFRENWPTGWTKDAIYRYDVLRAAGFLPEEAAALAHQSFQYAALKKTIIARKTWFDRNLDLLQGQGMTSNAARDYLTRTLQQNMDAEYRTAIGQGPYKDRNHNDIWDLVDSFSPEKPKRPTPDYKKLKGGK